MSEFSMKVDVRKVPNNANLFQFTITTAALRSQFILPRHLVNKLRILIEKALINKPG